MPFLALAGALDEKFCHNAQAMAETAPHGHTAIISGAGHAAHLERPADTARAIFDFLGVEN
jgi:2-succinyl-6-hydroxy-2,4-cyclohexadiene-1-carboxylate synthase